MIFEQMKSLPESAVILSTIHMGLPGAIDASHTRLAEAHSAVIDKRSEGYRQPTMEKSTEDYLKSTPHLKLIHAFPVVGDLSAPEALDVIGVHNKQMLVTVNYLVRRGILVSVGSGINRSRSRPNGVVLLYRRVIPFSRDLLYRTYPEASKSKISALLTKENKQWEEQNNRF